MQAEHSNYNFRVIEGGRQGAAQPEEFVEDSRQDINMTQYEKHTLPTDEETLEKIEAVTSLAGSRGQGENKDLLMHVKPIGRRIWYAVMDHQQTIYEGPSLLAAIDTYNRV